MLHLAALLLGLFLAAVYCCVTALFYGFTHKFGDGMLIGVCSFGLLSILVVCYRIGMHLLQ
jgi:hypothetical protein